MVILFGEASVAQGSTSSLCVGAELWITNVFRLRACIGGSMARHAAQSAVSFGSRSFFSKMQIEKARAEGFLLAKDGGRVSIDYFRAFTHSSTFGPPTAASRPMGKRSRYVADIHFAQHVVSLSRAVGVL